MLSNLEDKVKRYIRMKKFFIFSDALIITGAPKDTLLKIIYNLEKEGLIIQDKNEKPLMSRSYIVLSRKDKKSSLEDQNLKIDTELIKSLNKVVSVLENIQLETEEIIYYKVFNQIKLTKGVFAKTIKSLVDLNVLIEKNRSDFTSRENRTFTINIKLMEVLLTFLKQKKYKDLQEVLEGKKPLRYVIVPKEFTQILNVIIKNEVLKQDELAHLSKITRKRLKDWWQIIINLGIVRDSFSENKKVSFIFSSSRARVILAHINDGAYEKDKELKHLWIMKESTNS